MTKRRRALFTILALGAVIGAWYLGRSAPPPARPDDLCAIFAEKASWYRAVRRAEDRWQVSGALQLAFIHQESAFIADARPPRSRILWILPGPRPSSARGYTQAIDATWAQYRASTESRFGRRNDFANAAAFVAWYVDQIHRATGIDKSDAHDLYLAYHEGPRGYREKSFAKKEVLLQTARRVAQRTLRYRSQYEGCRARLQRRELTRRFAFGAGLLLAAAALLAWLRRRF